MTDEGAHGFAKGRTSDAASGSWRTPPDVLADVRQLAGWGPWAFDLAATARSSVTGPAPEGWWGPGHPTRPDALEATHGIPASYRLRAALDNVPANPAPVAVWCNPPYDLWADFARVLADAARDYGVSGALLVFARTDTAAWHDVAPRALAQCYRKGRVKFLGADGVPGGSAPAPTVALLFGPKTRGGGSTGPVDTASGNRWLVVRP